MRIVADTNIHISALVFGGVPEEIIFLAKGGSFDLFISVPIQEEIAKVLTEKFGWSPERITKRIDRILSVAQVVTSKPLRSIVTKADPSDDRILGCAIAAKAEVIVSGDRHLLQLGSFEKIPIMSPRAFVDSKMWA